MWGADLGPKVGEVYPLSAFNDTGSTADAVVSAITYIASETAFICPSYFVLRSDEAAGTNAFGYRFNHTPSCPWLREPGIGAFPSAQLAPYFGATHTSELPFIFGNLENLPFNDVHCNSTPAEYGMSSQLRAAWTAMAARGNPTSDSLDWPRFISRQGRGVFVQDSAYASKLDFEECTFWAKMWNTIAGEDLLFI